MDIEDFIDTSNRISTIPELFDRFVQALECYGYDRILFALMTDHSALRIEAKHDFLKTYPHEWIEHYFSEGFIDIDPVRQLVYTRKDIFTWEDIQNAMPLSKIQQRMFHEAKDGGLHNGMAIPVFGPEGSIACIGAARSIRQLEQDQQTHKDLIHLLSLQFYTCFWRLMEQKPLQLEEVFTDREKDIICWSARGLSRKQVADKLYISEHTVDYHIRKILKKTKTKNLTAAVYQAINRGVVQL